MRGIRLRDLSHAFHCLRARPYLSTSLGGGAVPRRPGKRGYCGARTTVAGTHRCAYTAPACVTNAPARMWTRHVTVTGGSYTLLLSSCYFLGQNRLTFDANCARTLLLLTHHPHCHHTLSRLAFPACLLFGLRHSHLPPSHFHITPPDCSLHSHTLHCLLLAGHSFVQHVVYGQDRDMPT